MRARIQVEAAQATRRRADVGLRKRLLGPRRGGQTMNQFFTTAILSATVASAIQFAAPFLLAALGETVGQRSGVLNLGVDGIMLLGAFATYYVALQTGSLALGILVGVGIGMVMGLVTAFMSVTLKAQQGISGIGVYLFGLGLSDLLFVEARRHAQTPEPPSRHRHPAPQQDPGARAHVLQAERPRLHRFSPRACADVRAQPDDVWHEGPCRRREPGGRRQPRRAASPGSATRRCIFGSRMAGLAGATLARARRHLPAEPDPERRASSPSPSCTSVHGDRQAFWPVRSSTG